MNKINRYRYNNIYQQLHIIILQGSDSWWVNIYLGNTSYNSLCTRLFTSKVYQQIGTSVISVRKRLKTSNRCLLWLWQSQENVLALWFIHILIRQCSYSSNREQGMAQWWEHLPPTNVGRAQIPASTPYVGWICCWFSPLLWEVFLQVLRFSPLLKNQHFQLPIRPGIR